MPWVIAKQGDEFCTFAEGEDGQATGETLGCHPTEDEAKAQLAALYASEPEVASAHAALEPQTRMLRAYMERAATPSEPGSPMRFIASTEDIARDGGIVSAEGWQLDSYRANPVVLWAHDYSMLPLGRADVEVRDGKLMAEITWDQADDFARQVEGKYQRGFLNAVSVGWNTTKYADGRALPEGAHWMSLEHELLDVSAVPVPADPGALVARQRRLMSEWARSILQSDDAGPLNIVREDSQPAPTGEAEWREVAAAMVAVLSPAADDPEEARLERYKALLPKYRRHGRTAPEFLDAVTLSALGPAERRGLFLAGEPDLLPDQFAVPEPPKKADAGRVESALGAIQARLTALERRSTPDTHALEGIIARLEGLGAKRAVSTSQPEPPAPMRAAGGDDGERHQDGTDARGEPTDTTLQAILEKLERLT